MKKCFQWKFHAIYFSPPVALFLISGCALQTKGIFQKPPSDVFNDEAMETYETLPDDNDPLPDFPDDDQDMDDERPFDTYQDEPPGDDVPPEHEVVEEDGGFEDTGEFGEEDVGHEDMEEFGEEDLCVPPDPPWWDNNWISRRHLTVDAALADYTYQVELDVTTTPSSNEIHALCLPSGNDLRVLVWDGSNWTQIDRYLEYFESSVIKIWFKNVNPTAEYYMYYDNPGAAMPPEDLQNVFLWFDDFNRSDGDPGIGSIYDTYGSGTWVISGGELVQNSTHEFTFMYITAGVDWENIELTYIWRSDPTGDIDCGPIVQWLPEEAGGQSGYYIERQSGTLIVWELPDLNSLLSVSATEPSRDWHSYRTVKIDDRLAFYEDGAFMMSSTGVIASGAGTAGVATYETAYPFHFDDLKVRMLIEPEPSVLVGEEERDCL
jgi:hypothetical protein